MDIVVEKLEKEINEGDWHDKPLRWVVKGPGSELQHFGTKKDADTYKRIRKSSTNLKEATKAYIDF